MLPLRAWIKLKVGPLGVVRRGGSGLGTAAPGLGHGARGFLGAIVEPSRARLCGSRLPQRAAGGRA